MSGPGGARRSRFRLIRPALTVVILGFAVHLLLPQLAELGQGFQALKAGRWWFLTLSVLGTGLSLVTNASMVRASVNSPPSWRRTTVVQLAGGAAATVTPMGIGWAAVNQAFLQREGIDEPTARAATALNIALTLASHVALLLALLPFLPSMHLPTVSAPQRRIYADIVVAVAVLAGVVYWIPRLRSKATNMLLPIFRALSEVVRDPRRSAKMVLGAVATNLAYGVALFGAVAAFGPPAPPLGVLVVYLLAATVGAIAPTPGGLGAMETALTAGLIRLSVTGGQAVAATLGFRLATFWLPLALGALALRYVRSRGLV